MEPASSFLENTSERLGFLQEGPPMRTLLVVVLAALLALMASPFLPRVRGEQPPEYVEGLQVDWGLLPRYMDVVTTPRLERSDNPAAVMVTFVVEVKELMPAGKHWMARFYDADGFQVKWSVVDFEPALDMEVPGRSTASIWWIPDMMAVANVKILME
jgi:hypothetical protein